GAHLGPSNVEGRGLHGALQCESGPYGALPSTTPTGLDPAHLSAEDTPVSNIRPIRQTPVPPDRRVYPLPRGTRRSPSPDTLGAMQRRNETKHLQIAQTIVAEVRAGRPRIGETLPSESGLAERFGVARGTIRRALEHLEAAHRIISRRGSRWVVHHQTLA